MLVEAHKKNYTKQHSELFYWTSNGQFRSKMDLCLGKVSKITSASQTKRQFWIRTIRTWNALTDILDLSIKNVNAFNSVMRDFYNTVLRNTYDCDDVRTFKTICPRCNRAGTLTVPVNYCFLT